MRKNGLICVVADRGYVWFSACHWLKLSCVWRFPALYIYFKLVPRLSLVIGLENLRHHLNQSNSSVKPILTRSIEFSRALGSLLVFTLTCHWLLVKKSSPCLVTVASLVLV